MLGDLFILCISGSLLLLLRHEVGPILIHRPIAAGPLLGGLVGIPETGFFLGACLEWIWIDRIPAGGIRTPAVTAGLTAGLTLPVYLSYAAIWPIVGLDYVAPALLLAGLYMILFIPLDGGLRRLWNLTSEGVVAALDRGSVIELKAYAPTVLLLRWFVVMVGLLSAPLLVHTLYIRSAGFGMVDAPTLWPWIIPAVIGGFVLRRGYRKEIATAGLCFLIGVALACYR